MEDGVKLSKIAEQMGLINFTENIDLSEHIIKSPDVNRPALQLNGFYEHFENERVQIIGNVEMAYLDKKSDRQRKNAYKDFECSILNVNSQLIKDGNKFTVVKENGVYSVG